MPYFDNPIYVKARCHDRNVEFLVAWTCSKHKLIQNSIAVRYTHLYACTNKHNCTKIITHAYANITRSEFYDIRKSQCCLWSCACLESSRRCLSYENYIFLQFTFLFVLFFISFPLAVGWSDFFVVVMAVVLLVCVFVCAAKIKNCIESSASPTHKNSHRQQHIGCCNGAYCCWTELPRALPLHAMLQLTLTPAKFYRSQLHSFCAPYFALSLLHLQALPCVFSAEKLFLSTVLLFLCLLH